MNNTRALFICVLAPALMQAAVGSAQADQTLRLGHIAREVRHSATRYQGRNRVQQSEVDTQTFRIGANGLLELHNVAGDIIVTAGRGDQATIEITKTAHGTTDADAREQLGLVTVEVRETANRIEVRARYPEPRRSGRRNINVTTVYKVTAPAGTRIKAESISGNVHVTGIKGDLALGTISGNLAVGDAGRRINGKTISGNVEILSAQDDAVVELSTTSGNATAQGVRVRRLDLGSISGTVTGRDIRCDQATFHTMSGNVEYTGALAPNGRYSLRTHSGDVRLTVSGGTGFELEASTFSGEVRSGLPLSGVDASSRRNRRIRATYGDGKAHVEASSFSGNVLINGR